MNGSSSSNSYPQPGIVTATFPVTSLQPNNAMGIDYGVGEKEIEYEKEFREIFSKSTLKNGIQGYLAGKYTKRYIEAYLEFMHLSGWISNLEYLEFKTAITKE